MTMSKIDEINERLSDLAAGKIVKYDNAMNLATQYALDYKNDVEYLLELIKENANEWAGFVEKEARIYLDAINQLQGENERLQGALKDVQIGVASIILSSGGKLRIPQQAIQTLPPLEKLLFKSFQELETGDYIVTVEEQ